jgi:hypothetical protein
LLPQVVGKVVDNKFKVTILIIKLAHTISPLNLIDILTANFIPSTKKFTATLLVTGN